MAEIDDALPNQSVSDEEFKETEVTEVETPNEDIIEASEDVEVTMDDDGGAEAIRELARRPLDVASTACRDEDLRRSSSRGGHVGLLVARR